MNKFLESVKAYFAREKIKATVNASPKKKTAPLFSMSVRFSVKDQMLFAKRLSFLIKSNVPILESLHILKEQSKGGGAQRVYERLITDISSGQYLHVSMKRFGNTFGHFALNIIKVGELSGILSQNLIYLANELEKRYELKRRITGALVYPIVITLATLGITGLLTVFIFPKIMPIFASLAVELPFTTKMLLAMSTFLQKHGILTFFVLAACWFALAMIIRASEKVRFVFDYAFLKMPIVGTIMAAYNMSNFNRTLGLLLKSGLKITDALLIVAETTENLVYRKEYLALAKSAERGEQISKTLSKRAPFFPAMTTHMIAIGEKTGSLSDTLLYLSDMYEAELNDLTKNLSSILEPILMLVMGLVVGFVAVSVIAPIYEITQSLQR
ncbi:type II secretion system F family protein [Patescibacteria group bacterium]|nr:type II secretion system F family protein [Patescibacteria group bacterium]